MVIADTLSRACCNDTNTDSMEEELSCAIHMTVALYNTPTSDVRLQEVKERQHHAVTETNCAVRMARKKNTSTQRSPRILEHQE